MSGTDSRRELRFALDQGYAEAPPVELSERVRREARLARAPGSPIDAVDPATGADTYRRAVAAMDTTLGELTRPDWSRPAIRDLDVQGLIGHLIGVESAFIESLSDRAGPSDPDHVGSTQRAVSEQSGRPPAATIVDWRVLTSRVSVRVSALTPDKPVHFYGFELPLDQMLVVRAFEMWVHEEDIRRATGRSLNPPAAAPLASMSRLAVTLLPLALRQAGKARDRRSVRLVLTGPAGGVWDVPYGAEPGDSSGSLATVVVDATEFCRVVGNRLSQADTGTWMGGDLEAAGDLLSAASTLALD